MKYPAASHFVDGKCVAAEADMFPVISPVDGSLLSQVPLDGASVVTGATEVAAAAQKNWASPTIAKITSRASAGSAGHA